MQRAEADYQTARSTLRRKQPYTHVACFHAQQCAEKCLKALLVARDQEIPKVHDLQTLNDMCSRAGVLLPIDADFLDSLSFFAVQARYPGEDPTIEEAQEALEIARAVRRFARKFLGLK
jgi:HEPN domain-containing protein